MRFAARTHCPDCRRSITTSFALGGAEDLADADLLGSPFGGERRQPEEPEAAQENGKNRESDQEQSRPLFGLIEFFGLVAEKESLERLVGNERLPGPPSGSGPIVPDFPGRSGRRRRVPAPGGSRLMASGWIVPVKGLIMEILENPDDRPGLLSVGDRLADGIGPAEGGGKPPRRFLVQDEGIIVGRSRRGRKTVPPQPEAEGIHEFLVAGDEGEIDPHILAALGVGIVLGRQGAAGKIGRAGDGKRSPGFSEVRP